MDVISPGFRFCRALSFEDDVCIAGKAALPLELHMRDLAAKLSWYRDWWVTQSLGGEGFGELAGVGGAEGAGSAFCPIPGPAWVYSAL